MTAPLFSTLSISLSFSLSLSHYKVGEAARQYSQHRHFEWKFGTTGSDGIVLTYFGSCIHIQRSDIFSAKVIRLLQCKARSRPARFIQGQKGHFKVIN